MKRHQLLSILVVVFIGVFPFFNTQAQETHSDLVGYIASDSPINVRNRPNGTVVFSLPPNQSVTITGKSDDGKWLSFELPDGKTGWVSAAFVRVMPSAIPSDLVPLTPDTAAHLEEITPLAAAPSGGVVFSPDGRIVASNSWQRQIEIYDVRTKILIAHLTKQTDLVTAVAFSPDGSDLASSSRDGSVIIWSTQTWGARQQLLGHTDGVNSLAYSPDGKRIASVGMDGKLIIWNVQTGERIQEIEVGSRRANHVAFSPDGTRIATSTDYADSELRLWDVASGKLVWQKRDVGNLHIVFSPDGNTLLMASGGVLSIAGFNVQTETLTFFINGGGGNPSSLAVNPSGTLVAAGTWGSTFVIADMATRKWLFSKNIKPGKLNVSINVAFSPDDRVLVTTDGDRNITLWGVHGSD